MIPVRIEQASTCASLIRPDLTSTPPGQAASARRISAAGGAARRCERASYPLREVRPLVRIVLVYFNDSAPPPAVLASASTAISPASSFRVPGLMRYAESLCWSAESGARDPGLCPNRQSVGKEFEAASIACSRRRCTGRRVFDDRAGSYQKRFRCGALLRRRKLAPSCAMRTRRNCLHLGYFPVKNSV
jgi:hypothetical protein